jgi:hypothetical protein
MSPESDSWGDECRTSEVFSGRCGNVLRGATCNLLPTYRGRTGTPNLHFRVLIRISLFSILEGFCIQGNLFVRYECLRFVSGWFITCIGILAWSLPLLSEIFGNRRFGDWRYSGLRMIGCHYTDILSISGDVWDQTRYLSNTSLVGLHL